jgi:alkanesulfonate monooxygenase SsuD/methylene tetrahydromethanopterin reductase-like flavin-dependent oxidoreductase (luciferase family)
MKVRFAISAGARLPEPEGLHQLVTEAERLGFDTLWFSDLTTAPATDPLLSVALAAAWTSRIKLGITVVPFGYQPFVFARQLAQVDRLSRGRLRVMLVPGLGSPGERIALGIEDRDRGRLLDELIPALRDLWAGRPLGDPDGPTLATLPEQEHLQIWLAGKGPKALARAGRLADGWRGGATSAARAAQTVAAIQKEAAAVGRTIDSGHFGLTIPYARDRGDLADTGPVHEDAAAVGRDGLRQLVADMTGAGLSKFSVRRITPVRSWGDELAWLAEALLDLQS